MADEIGARLREARMRAKIDINEVETRTKIRAKYLRAIENEEWDLLPGEVYAKSFLRTYGQFLGLDTRQLLDDFRRRYERPADHELRPITPPGRDRPRRRRGVPPWAVIGVVLVLVVVALYVVGKHHGHTPTSTTTTQTRTPPTHPAKRGRHRRRAATTTKPSSVRLQLQPTGSVYVCLVTGTGHKLIGGQVFTLGQTIPTFTRQGFLLTLGNANVKITANGVTVPVAPSSGPIGYRFVPGGHTSLSASQQPQCT